MDIPAWLIVVSCGLFAAVVFVAVAACVEWFRAVRRFEIETSRVEGLYAAVQVLRRQLSSLRELLTEEALARYYAGATARGKAAQQGEEP